MINKQTIGVIVPAHNEELLISRTITTMPDFVDKIVVIDDVSTDRTNEVVKKIAETNEKILLIEHSTNKGVGGAISTGYLWCRENDIDIAVVMAGDAQMDPEDMPALLEPVLEDRVDYAKGNRLVSGEAWEKIPRIRYLGNSILTFLTKIASGYWHITDSQTGYTALNRKGLTTLPLEKIYPRYGMPNDFLVTCNIYNMRVCDVPVKPIYNIGERSGINIRKAIFSLSFLIVKLFFKRMVQKYIIRDFHPLVLFYSLGGMMFLLAIPLTIRLFYLWYQNGTIPAINALTIVFFTFMSFQMILFAMLFDMQANKHLYGQN